MAVSYDVAGQRSWHRLRRGPGGLPRRIQWPARSPAAAKVGFVGDLAADLRSANYVAGFRSGASQAGKSIGVSIAYAGTPEAPDKGRTAAAGLVKSGVGVISALPDLSGIGAFREACGLKARLVAVDTDAWQVVPDVFVPHRQRPEALRRRPLGTPSFKRPPAGLRPRSTLEDVATGGSRSATFHADRPAGFDSQLAGVLAALANPSSGSSPKPSAQVRSSR